MIRLIKKSELETCAKVIQESFFTVAKEYGFTKENAPNFIAFSITPEKLYSQQEEGRLIYGYFDCQGQILGCYSLHMQEGHTCEFNHLCVLPQYRHRRIGEILFSHALRIAEEKGAQKVNFSIIEENNKIRIWYETLGANHIGTKKFDFFPFTCGYMELVLAQEEIKLQKGETIAYRWVDKQEFREIYNSNQFVNGLRNRLRAFVEQDIQ